MKTIDKLKVTMDKLNKITKPSKIKSFKYKIYQEDGCICADIEMNGMKFQTYNIKEIPFNYFKKHKPAFNDLMKLLKHEISWRIEDEEGN